MFRNVIRAGTLARCFANHNNHLSVNQFEKPLCLILCRSINTTDKKKDSHVEIYDPEFVNNKMPRAPKTAEEFANLESQKHWVSHGFDYVDQENDKLNFHMAMFSWVTLGCIFITYMIFYFPDYQLKDWALREAFIQLDHREKAGLPLIDPNLVDPAKIQLPNDEELGDYKVYL